MNHRTTRPTSVGRATAVTFVVALIAGVTVACSPPPTTPSTPSTTQKFCEFWEKVEEAPPAADNAVLVKDDVVALADDTLLIGQECTDPGAKVALDGAVLAEGEEVLAEEGNPNGGTIAAVTGDEIAAEAPVLENLTIKTLSADIGTFGIRVRGNVAVRLSGTTSTIGFVGTLQNLNNWSVTLSSSALTIPGVTSTPATFSGTLSSNNGVPSLSLSAAVTTAKIGDVTVNGASVNFTASPATGVAATVQGNIKVGPSNASGTVNVVFDKAGALVHAKADIAARLVGTQAGGKQVDLQGNVTFEGNAQETVATFSGSGVIGDLNIHEASGSLSLGVNKATFIGKIDVAEGANYVRYNGSIVWDGIAATVPFMTLEAGGEISGTLPNGQTVTANGEITSEIIGGQMRTTVTGDFTVGSLKASGSAIVEYAGATTTLFFDADLIDAGFNATLEGAVIITDGRAETVHLDAAVTGAVNFGDATMTGATLSVRSSYGSPLELTFNGGLKVGTQADVTGTIAATFGPNGSLLSLDGNVTGSMNLGSWNLNGFSGRVIASPDQVTVSGSGSITMTNFPLGVTFSGSLTSSLNEPTWSLNGTGNLRIASINVASARLSLSQTAGMRATRVGFYFTVLIFPSYFEGDFYMKPAGGCEKVNITGGGLLVKALLPGPLSGVLGCPVHT